MVAGNRGGQPSPIDSQCGFTPDGQPVTVSERIIGALQNGNYFEFACRFAGVTKETGYEWLRVGARARIRAKGRALDTIGLTPHELRCVEFSDAVAVADATWTVLTNQQLERLGRGGVPQVVVTEKEVNGVVVERTTRTTHTLPDANVLMWRLTRKHPQIYGNHIVVEHAGDRGDVSDDEHARELITGIEGFLAGAADAQKRTRTNRPTAPRTPK